MKKFGLIGFPLTHSFSKNYFEQKFASQHIEDCSYENFGLQSIELFPDLILSETNLTGLNVTIPYKEKIFSYLDETDEQAKQTGAVNTIKIIKTGDRIKLTGYNTDIYGFSMSIKPFLKNTHHRALILGNGGAAKAVIYVLKNLGIDYLIITRHPENNELGYESLNEYIIKSHLLIINTTPAGMYPNINDCPAIPYQFLNAEHLLYDLIYNPEETLFMQKGKMNGATVLNGLSMLKLQAEKSWEIWNS